jgi:hypothetical protein
MDLRRYWVINARPVMAIEAADGGLDILAWDRSTGEFVRDLGYLTRVSLPDEEGEVVSREQFDEYVAEVRTRHRR